MDLISCVQFDDIDVVSNRSKRVNLCVISQSNIVAFSLPRCYKLPKTTKIASGEEKYTSAHCDFGGVADSVFVCCLSSPWNIHHVATMEYEIKHLLWDFSGTKLVIADASGAISLWQMHESLINVWMLTNLTKSFYADEIISLKWINSTQMVSSIAKDYRDHILYDRKYPLTGASAPNIYGGRSIDYWVAVTSSGVVGVGMVQQKSEMVVSKTLLENYESACLSYADIVMEYERGVQIVTSTGRTKDPIRIFKLTIDIMSNGYFIQSGSISVDCIGYSCFLVDKCTENDAITSLHFMHPLNGQTVLVTISKPQGSEIQQWTVCDETLNLHPAFYATANQITPEKYYYWIRQTSVQLPSFVTACATVPLLTDSTSLLPIGTVFSCDDKSLKFTSRQSINETTSCSTRLQSDSDISSLAISTNGCVCVAIMSDCAMYIFGETNMSTERITVLLEHTLISGYNSDDILMCMRSDCGLHDKVLQVIESNLSKQLPGMQSLMKTKVMQLKVKLAFGSEQNGGFAADYLTSLLLNHARNSFFSILSSSQYDELDQNTEERFVDALSDPSTDVDKLTSYLQPTADFLPDESLVMSLQPAVQWICDLATTILSSLPVYSITNKTGAWIAQDIPTLHTIRELLILVKLWYATVPKLRPALTCSMSYDAVGKLFRLLSMLITSRKKGEPLSDAFLDECSLLSTQLVLPPFDKSCYWSRLSPIICPRMNTVKYTFGDEPEALLCRRLPFGQYISNAKKDIFSHVEVGFSKEGFKQCIRCQAITTVSKPINEQRMPSNPVVSHYCICGGIWAHISTQ